MTSTNQQSEKSPLKLILLAGLLVGSLDILTALTDYYIATGKGPEGVLRYIASGVFGKAAFSGSSMMMFWGLLFHYVIAFSFTILFYLLYPRVAFIRNQPILFAVLYGIFMWAVTTQIVMPLSNTPKPPSFPPLWKIAKAILILIVMIALPLTFIMKKYFSNNTPKTGLPVTPAS